MKTMSQSKWRRLKRWTPAYVAEAIARARFGFFANHPRKNPKPTPRGEGWPQEAKVEPKRVWGLPPLESQKPHEIVDQDGLVRSPMPGMEPFKSRSAATRWLKFLISMTAMNRPQGKDNPRNWRVRAVRQDEQPAA